MANTSGYQGLEPIAVNPVIDEEHAILSARPSEPQSAYERARHGGKWFLTGLLCTGFALILCLWGQGKLGTQKAQVKDAVTFDVTMVGEENADTLPSCSWATDNNWHPLTCADERAIAAVTWAFKIASKKRQDCPTPLAALDWEPANFVRDVQSDFHVEISHKFSGDCSSEFFDMKFSITNVEDFAIQVSRDRITNLWELVDAAPKVCDLNVYTSSDPQLVDANAADVKKVVEFAVGELNFYSTSESCLGSANVIKLASVKSAMTSVMSGVMYSITAVVFYNGVKYPSVTLNVLQKCGTGLDKCALQLLLPEGVSGDKVCEKETFEKILEGVAKDSKSTRRLGTYDEDKADTFASHKKMLYPRRLADDKDPLRERYIKEGDVPDTYDPSQEDLVKECMAQVVVYDQGECGSDYASAFAQMMGIRSCIELAKHPPPTPAPTPAPKKDDAKDDKKDRRLTECEDDSTWSAYGAEAINCQFFKEHGCDGYTDFGQLSNCKATCGVCDKLVAKDPSPYVDAKYSFMPSIAGLATCARGVTGAARGCAGGNMWDLWNNYLSGQTGISVEGEACMPNNLKCFYATDPINPLYSTDICDTFEDYATWDKPCPCIDEKDHVHELPECPSDAPKAACEFKVPVAAFVVTGVAGGLSGIDAVINFQRHIVEFGPVYVTVLTQSAFVDWDFKNKPVYTGGGETSTAVGGHAMIATGWGTSSGTPYWIVRNSWGPNWADKGSCLFLRGANLDGIENHGGVTMPVSDFKDWSAPICRITSWRRQWSYEGTTLYSYDLHVKIRCNEDADVKIFFSKIVIGDRDAVNRGTSGINKEVNGVQAKKETDVDVVSMTLLNFGIEEGDMWIQITSTDAAENQAVTTNFLSIPKVPGMVQIQNI